MTDQTDNDSNFDNGDTDIDKCEDRELLVGSIKTIIGHTEGTAGVAGVLKASLALQHGRIPAGSVVMSRSSPKGGTGPIVTGSGTAHEPDPPP